MRTAHLSLGLACLAGFALFPASAAPPTIPPEIAMKRISSGGMVFEQNTGHYNNKVRFLSRTNGATLFYTDGGVTMVLPGKPRDVEASLPSPRPIQRGPGHVLRMRLVGAQSPSSVAGLQKSRYYVNYFTGNDRGKWRAHVPTFKQARFAGVYPGTDLVYYGNNGRLEYDFVVKPGGDPGKVRLAFDGATRLTVAANGDLVAGTSVGDVHLQRPYAYQMVGGRRLQVACGYEIAPGARQVAFRTARYDTARPLVLDPSIDICTLLGGSGSDYAYGVAMNSSGDCVVTGKTSSANFPTTTGALYTAKASGDDAFVTMIPDNGQGATFSTYLGGSGADVGYRAAVGPDDAIYVLGQTTSTNFPVTPGSLRTTLSGAADAFVTKLSSNGSALVYSTYVGGSSSDHLYGYGGLAVNASGEAVVAVSAMASDLPGASTGVQPTNGGQSVEIARLNAAGSGILAATYWGGTTGEGVFAAALGPDGDIYVAGYTQSGDFPTTPGAFQATKTTTGQAGFVARFNSGLTACRYSTFLEPTSGSGAAQVRAVVTNSDGSVYAAGLAYSPFPTTTGAYQTTQGGGQDAFIAKVSSDGKAVPYATLLGGTGSEFGTGLGCTPAGDVVAMGYLSSGSNIPCSSYAIKKGPASANDLLLAVLSADLSTAKYITLLGGSSSEQAYCGAVSGLKAALVGTGSTSGSPVTPGAFQSAHGGGSYDGLLMRVLLGPTTGAIAVTNKSGDPGATVTLTATFTSGANNVTGKSISFTVGGVSAGAATTDSSGVASLSYIIPAGASGGDQVIEASFAGEDYLSATTGTGKLTVNQTAAATSLVLANASGNIGGSVDLKATLTSSSIGLSNKTVTFKKGSTTLGTATTDASGVATLAYTIPLGTAAGDATLTASFAGDASYTASTGNGTLTVSKIATAMTVADSSGIPGQDTKLSAALKAGGTALAGKSVSFTVAGSNAGSGTTDANGVATVTYTVPGNTLVGNKVIGASYSGENDYASSNGTGTLSVDTIATTLTVSAPASLVISAYETVSAALTQTTGGAAVSGKTIAFSLGAAAIGTAVTDTDGKATLDFVVPDSATSGNTTIAASFAGTTAYAAADGQAAVSLVDHGGTYGYAAPASGKRGDQVTLYCYVYRNVAPRRMLAGKAVSITVDGTQVGSGTTDRNGSVSVKWTIPGTITPGAHTLAYTFAGDSHYDAWTGTKTLTVNSRADLFAGSMPDGSPGATVTLYAYLYDKISGEPYTNQELSFAVDGVTVGTGTTDALGKAPLSYTVPATMAAGNHSITVTFAGNAGVPAASGTGKLVVKEKAVTAIYVRSYPLAVPGAKLPLYCYLYVKQGRVMLPGKQVTISVDGVDVATPTTDSNGYAAFKYTVPSGSGTHVVTITFAGDAENQGVSGTGVVTVP